MFVVRLESIILRKNSAVANSSALVLWHLMTYVHGDYRKPTICVLIGDSSLFFFIIYIYASEKSHSEKNDLCPVFSEDACSARRVSNDAAES